MRNGSLLAEDAPKKLMEFYGCESLEETFLKLCDKDANEHSSSQVNK